MRKCLHPFLILLLLAPATSGLAASSPWHKVEGGAIRLVTADQPENGMLRGALEIRLEPGWKTYWREPGETGVPPQLDLAASEGVSDYAIRFPAPRRIDDGYSVWAGYRHSVALALEFIVDEAPRIAADVFLGICQTICIPVQAHLAVDSTAGTDIGEIAAVVQAFAALPSEAKSDFRVDSMHHDAGNSRLLAGISVPEQENETELFVADPEGWRFGIPTPLEGAPQVFAIPVLARPKEADTVDISYTLLNGNEAVAGILRVTFE